MLPSKETSNPLPPKKTTKLTVLLHDSSDSSCFPNSLHAHKKHFYGKIEKATYNHFVKANFLFDQIQ